MATFRQLLGIIRANKLYYAISLFIVIFVTIYYIKPAIIFDESGNLRTFGYTYKTQTILPIWLISIISAIFSYLFILYITGHHKLQFIY